MNKKKYAITIKAAPVLNTPFFDQVFSGNTLPLDDQGLLRSVETVLFPGTKLEILEICSSHIARVRIPQDYPYGDRLYIDCRFLKDAHPDLPERTLAMPASEKVLERLKNLAGMRYIWGGTALSVPEIPLLYPPSKPIDKLSPIIRDTWQLTGADCSGLLHFTTNGATPRNTSQLVHFGKPVSIANTTSDAMIKILQPLDAIVWKGHIVFILNSAQIIESRAGYGVVITSIDQRLKEIMQERKPMDEWNDMENSKSGFVVRRWHPESIDSSLK